MTRAFVLFALLSACADLPKISNRGGQDVNPGQTPALLTSAELERLTAPAQSYANALSGEAAALRARGDQLRRR